MKKDSVTFVLQEILNKFPDGCAFAGGCVREMLLNEEIKDYDVFCQNEEVENKLIAFLKTDLEAKLINENSLLANFIFQKKWIQLIRGKHFDLTNTDLIDSFDYTICCAMVSKNGFVCHKDFFEAIATKTLRINQITYPLSTLERLQKYIKKGYTACNGTLLEIAKSIQTINLSPKKENGEDNTENTLVYYPNGGVRFLGVD